MHNSFVNDNSRLAAGHAPWMTGLRNLDVFAYTRLKPCTSSCMNLLHILSDPRKEVLLLTMPGPDIKGQNSAALIELTDLTSGAPDRFGSIVNG